MEKFKLFSGRARCPCRPGLQCESIPQAKRPWLIPSRFISICPRGHIEDFPFMEWVHREQEWDHSHKLRLLPGRSSASLSGIRIQCNCGKSETMARAFNFDPDTGGTLHSIGFDCSGGKPWFGEEGLRNQCGEYLRVAQRGASNVYFPLTVSSIYLPLWGEDTNRKINKMLQEDKIWGILTAGLDDGQYIQKARCEVVAQMRGVDPDQLLKAAQRKLDGQKQEHLADKLTEESFRKQEYDALCAGSGGDTTDLLVSVIPEDKLGQFLDQFLVKLCLVKKLRETRALVGFSRLIPIEDSTSPNLHRISQNENVRWLPANVVYGEGIFIEFNAKLINQWAKNMKIIDRITGLNETYNRRRTERGLDEERVSAKYVLLHTFAHALIGQFSFECGYGSAALRERIYCESHSDEYSMQGVLVYTASGDSEGTLGGLVRQGVPRRLRALVVNSIRRMKWCSSDPVCIESQGQGSDNANLAACHGCVLLPETSCEKGNRLLDRGLIVGSTDDPSIGFFDNMV